MHTCAPWRSGGVFGYFFDMKQKSNNGKEMKTILEFNKNNN